MAKASAIALAPIQENILPFDPPRLDKEIASILEERRRTEKRPLWQSTPEQARGGSDARSVKAGPVPDVAVVIDLDLDLPGRSIPARLYHSGHLMDVVIIFFHGGGFVTGSIDTHDRQARMLSMQTGRPVLSVGYRLAPENPFPAAYEDGVDSVVWAAKNIAAMLGANQDAMPRTAVVGSSAGANLAAGASRTLRGSAEAPIAQLLVYPLLSADSSPSRVAMAEGYGLTAKSIDWYLSHYLSEDAQKNDVRFSPLRDASFTDLPPTVISAARLDPLYDDAITYAEYLIEAGVEVHLLDNAHLNHAFWGYTGQSVQAKEAALAMCSWFKTLLEEHK